MPSLLTDEEYDARVGGRMIDDPAASFLYPTGVPPRRSPEGAQWEARQGREREEEAWRTMTPAQRARHATELASASNIPVVSDLASLALVPGDVAGGDWTGAGLNLLGVLPFVPGAIRAFHGSPHHFDRFRMDRIGTGEGAQAYGRGLYFAGSEDTARVYRDTLGGFTRPAVTLDGAPFNVRTLSKLADEGDEAARWAVQTLPGNLLTPSRMQKHLRDRLATLDGQVDHFTQGLEYRLNAGPNVQFSWSADDYRGRLAYLTKQRDHAQELLGRMDNVGSRPRGAMYEVELRADPERLLDWDKPMRAQPETQERLAGLRDRFARQDFEPRTQAEREWWGAQQGMLDTNAEALTHVQNPDMRGQDVMTHLGRKLAPGRTAGLLNEAGIPGVRYLDGNSRRAGEGTHNYVVWDDALIDILRKYGLAPLAAGGTAAAAAGGNSLLGDGT